jgi:GTP-binding protein EngB required for normal cell division
MDAAELRSLTGNLADDLAWLEGHCRNQPALAERAGELRLAAALVRNVVVPHLDGQPATPLHVAVVGGAGAGKSTIVNFLCGARAAEANPQAGFTRHPVAYTHAGGPGAWPSQAGFLGPLHRLDATAPSSLDEDVYQLRKVPSSSSDGQLLREFIVWDCPDMTTWAAARYVPRLLEIAGLADVIVYVASDERYNDAVPTEFLKLLLEVGKPVVVCLTKVKPENAAATVKHFEKEVLAEMPRGRVATLVVPFLPSETLADPVHRAAEHRIPLINQVIVLGDPAAKARARTVQACLRFLTSTTERLLAVARDDVAAVDGWKSLVRQGQREFDDRYRREYLTSEKFRRFDDALVRLLELLELPGAGKALSTTLWVLRTPYRLLKGAMSKIWSPIPGSSLPEEKVLDDALTAWLDQLRAEALRRSNQHPLWDHVADGFERGLGEQVRERYRGSFQSFQAGLNEEVERTARSIYEELEKSPKRLATLRSGKFALDVAAVTGSAIMGGFSALDLVLVPLAASVSHQLVEWLGSAYVDSQREATRNRQQALVAKLVSEPLGDWLSAWPTTGGTAYERMQLALSRVPDSIKKLDAEMAARLRGIAL